MPAWRARVHGKTNGTAPKQDILSLSGCWCHRDSGCARLKGKEQGTHGCSYNHTALTQDSDMLLTLLQWKHVLLCQGLVLLLQGLQQRHWDMVSSTPALGHGLQHPSTGTWPSALQPLSCQQGQVSSWWSPSAFAFQNECCSTSHRRGFCGLTWATTSLMGLDALLGTLWN